ncbi:MAG: hypothetical protein JJU02_09470 [Cryomorphaceae bacterium]|nr:hypothetical protein [Cryomorphaceae bacterium]
MKNEMIQLFLKTTKIEKSDWDNSYKRILKIVNQFPIKLERIESYDGFSRDIDKIHYDLIVNRGEEDEHISFWSDQMSYTSGYSISFYRNWEVQQKKLFGKETDIKKPIEWYQPKVNDFAGLEIEANGAQFSPDYIKTTALYSYAFLAIGIMLENTLPGRIFLVSLTSTIKEVNYTRKWLEYVFNESFDMPLYFDKARLLENITDYYDRKEDLVGRLDSLYKRQFKNNIEFAIYNIGYKPTFEYYAHVLAHTHWGTFGFSDVFLPWIAATKDLEKTLEILARSKQILLLDNRNEEAEKYNYAKILKDLLNQYILWTPEQREFLERFPNNKEAMETGKEDLFGLLMRMRGLRVNICPIYANSKDLFESFMYFDPKNGNEYKVIIDNWIEVNKNKYNEVVQRFSEMESKAKGILENESEKEFEQKNEMHRLTSKIEEFAQDYADSERFFIIEALKRNPHFMEKEVIIDELQLRIHEFCKKNIKDIEFQYKKEKEEKISIIKYWIKKKQLAVLSEFSNWLNIEADNNVLTSLIVLVSLKSYESKLSYARQLILLDKKYWHAWKDGEKYSLKKFRNNFNN